MLSMRAWGEVVGEGAARRLVSAGLTLGLMESAIEAALLRESARLCVAADSRQFSQQRVDLCCYTGAQV